MVISYDEIDRPREPSALAFTMVKQARQHFNLHPDFEKQVNWEWLMEHWVKDDKTKLRDLTILVMYETCGMPYHVIGRLFDMHQGNACRRASIARCGVRKTVLKMVDPKDLLTEVPAVNPPE